MKTYDSKAKPANRDAIPFEVDGRTYHFTPPLGNPIALRIIKLNPQAEDTEWRGSQAVLQWFSRGLHPEHESHEKTVEGCQACVLESKVYDDDDPFSFELLAEIANDMMGEVANRPPTSSSHS